MRGRILAAASAAALLVWVSAERSPFAENDMASVSEQNLVGTWQKATKESCASRYPAKIELHAGGIYGAPGAPEMGAYWHGGDWQITEDGRIAIQAANDAMVRYRIIEFSSTELTLEDESGCTFSYRRQAP